MKIEIKGSFTRLVEDASLVQNYKTPYTVEFIFSEDWTDFAKTALFEAGGASIAVALTSNQCTIPAECLKRAGVRLQIAVYGVKGSERKSTGWCVTSMILHRADLNIGSGNSGSHPSLPEDCYEQIMAVIGDLSAAGFQGKTLSEIIIEIRNSISDTASDEEVVDVINTVFGSASSEPETPDNTATDQEVDDLLNDVFGDTP